LLERLIDETRLEEFINTRSPAYKALRLDAGKLTKAEAIDLMMKEPNLIRRPLVLARRKALFGYRAGDYDDLNP
jgi:regulatory protein spx